MSNLVPNNGASFQDLGSLDLSDYKALIEQAQKESTSLASTEDVEVNYSNKLWKAHVETKLGKSDRITWGYPMNKKERENLSDDEIFEEVSTTAPEHYFVGLRGIILKVNYGLSLSEFENNKVINHCRTTVLENEMTGQTIESWTPLEVPVERPHQSKNDPHTPNKWLADRPHVKLYGSRPPVGMPDDAKTSKVRTCAECVAAGEHYIGTKEEFMVSGKKGNPSLPTCSLNGHMLFCVFQVGILDSSQVLTVPNGKAQMKWVDIQEANLSTKRPDGTVEKRTSPFILKIDGLTSSQHKPLGSGEYEIDIVTSGKNCYLPKSKLYSWGEYFKKYLHARNVTGEIRKIDLKGTTVYPVVTDVMLARRKQEVGGYSHVGVYTPVLDQNIIDRGEGLTQLDWLQAALQCLQIEEAMAKGESITTAPNLPGEAPEAALPEAASEEPVQEEVTNKPKSTFSAFTSPPEIK